MGDLDGELPLGRPSFHELILLSLSLSSRGGGLGDIFRRDQPSRLRLRPRLMLLRLGPGDLPRPRS